MKTGVVQLVEEFRAHLGHDDVSSRVVPLELSGRIEDYLVREFMQYVFLRSCGLMFCEFNLGSRGEQKVDISILSRDTRGEECIRAFLEAKYLQNRGRRWAGIREKYDEIRGTLARLAEQLDMRPKETHGGATVRLRSRSTQVYGLIFVGYTRRDTEPDESRPFIRRILRVASEHALRSHDHARPYLAPAFLDRAVVVLEQSWRCSLWIGLWRGPEST